MSSVSSSSPSSLRVGILIVSDTAAADPSTDKSVPILKATIEEEGGGKWSEVLSEIVRDDVLEIQRAVRTWTDADAATGGDRTVNLVLTSGGTGFAGRDWTPEVGRIDP